MTKYSFMFLYFLSSSVCEECLFKDERCIKTWSHCNLTYKGNNELFYASHLGPGLNASIV